MRTVVLGELPLELEALIARRRATGADLFDEIWDGEYHMNPAPRISHARLDAELSAALRPPARRHRLFPSGPFNLGPVDDYRVPDHGLHRTELDVTWCPTAALVVEVLSPDDESWEKLPFYAAHFVDEVVIADPTQRRLTWLGLAGDGYCEVDRSTVLDVAVDAVAAEIDWPPVMA